MKKQEIIGLLREKHNVLFDWLQTKGEQHWTYAPEGKWTTGQQIMHLIQSEQPLNRALKIPKFFLRYKFGKPNRPPRSYGEVVARYQEKLGEREEIVSPFSRNMPVPPREEMTSCIDKLKQESFRMERLIDRKWSEKDLDACLLPHPLMGRMLVREILQWTAYHTEHHFQSIRERAENRV